MKKKIFTLLICMSLCLSLLVILSSCGDTPTESIFKYLDDSDSDIGKAVTEKAGFELKGDVLLQDNNFIVTQDSSSQDANVYRIYSLKKGAEIKSYSVPSSPVQNDIESIYFEAPSEEDYLIVVKKPAMNSKYYYSLVDHEGNAVFESSDDDAFVSYRLGNAAGMFTFYDGHFTLGSVLYRIENASSVKVADTSYINSSVKSLEDGRYVSGKYVFLHTDSYAYTKMTTTVIVFDKNLAYEKSFEIDGEASTALWLESGKLLVLTATICDEDEKDYYLESSNPLGIGSSVIKTQLTTRLLDISDFTYEELDNHSVAIDYVTELEGIKLPEGKTLVSAERIEDKKLVGSPIFAILDENGELYSILDVPEGLWDIERTCDGKVLLNFEYGTQVYTADGKLEATLNDNRLSYIGNGYYSNGKAIYNSSMEKVLDISSFTDIKYLPSGAVFYTEFDVENYKYVQRMWKNGETSTLDVDVLDVEAWGYASTVMNTEDSSVTVTYFDINGNTLKTVVNQPSNPVYSEANYENGYLSITVTENDVSTVYIYE